ncbi:SIS domain-containing protein [Frondihabitans peucedani]|jgi:D-sedoheptulose 7-phosphate isomerase|uniref:SIS domain-containing protein n=1 Tax=Frondihabitans peucedani TaxID=598626 RepID=A0ABP8E6J2_9MICO
MTITQTAAGTRTTTQAATEPSTGTISEHIASLGAVLQALDAQAGRLRSWAETLADRLSAGHRLLAAGNGGSAAEAQHLTSEFVGRFQADRPAFSAVALHSETSAVTAIGNDYGFDQVFARQVLAHGRAGDVLLLLSTSGASGNLLEAAKAASSIGMTTWALTGPTPNPLASLVDDVIALPGASSNVQEGQLVAVHSLCLVFDEEIERRCIEGPDRRAPGHAGSSATSPEASGGAL